MIHDNHHSISFMESRPPSSNTLNFDSMGDSTIGLGTSPMLNHVLDLSSKSFAFPLSLHRAQNHLEQSIPSIVPRSLWHVTFKLRSHDATAAPPWIGMQDLPQIVSPPRGSKPPQPYAQPQLARLIIQWEASCRQNPTRRLNPSCFM
jgi:hypothetical protein